MAEIPRKPTFPDHIVQKIITRIQKDVDDEVIPVSAGIYTEEKLVQKLQAIPKPVLQDYDDRIFYQITEKAGICTVERCPVCNADFTNKRKPIFCHFCTKWRCQDCICDRQRLHPLDNNPSGKRYSICGDCDSKFLLLQLSHPYVENRILLQTAIVMVSKELQQFEGRVEAKQQRIKAELAEPKRKLAIKQSLGKKQEFDLKKNIQKLESDLEQQKNRKNILEAKKEAAKERAVVEKERQMREAQQRANYLQNAKEDSEKIQKSNSQGQDENMSSSDQDEKQNVSIQREQIEINDHQQEEAQPQIPDEEIQPEQQLTQKQESLDEKDEPVYQTNDNLNQTTKGEQDSQDRIQPSDPFEETRMKSPRNSGIKKDEDVSEKEDEPPMAEYFSQSRIPPAPEPDLSPQKINDREQVFSNFKKTIDEPQEDVEAIEAARKELLKQAIMKQRQWQRMQEDDRVGSVQASQKCKCTIF